MRRFGKSLARAYKTYFHPELTKVWDKDVRQPVNKVRRVVTRQNFGDEQTGLMKPFINTLTRIALVSPIGAVGVVLCISIVGLPIGLPIMAWVGAFVSKPIRKHPAFNADSIRQSTDNNADWSY